MELPSGCEVKPAVAFSSKLVPVMPGAAASAVAANSAAHVSALPASNWRILLLVFMARMSNLLGQASSDLGDRVNSGTDVDLGHHSAEVLGVVRQVVKLRRVQVELLAHRVVIDGATAAIGIARTARVENHVQRLATTEGDR